MTAAEPLRWRDVVAPVAVAVLSNPRLWLVALSSVFRLARKGWWHRRPFLPVPTAEYWHFRLVTVYGGNGDQTPTPADVISYLHWCRGMRAARADSLSAMERVLLLNATYEPLALVSDRRAVVLVLAGRAEAVAFRPEATVFHSAQMSIEVPAIVRLSHMVRIPRWARTPPLTRRAVLRRDAGRCAYCTDLADTVDHIIPKSRGGRHEWSNVVASCKRDNLAKGDRLLSELGWSLSFKPVAPDGHLWRLRHLADVDPLWEPYLAAAS